MIWIALKMLTADRGKYLGIIVGITFAALLMAQQSSIFCGLMLLTTSQIQDIQDANIWVMDPSVQYVDDVKPLAESDLYRVRGVRGVAWAVRLYKGVSRARLGDGGYQQMVMLGLDDATLVGAPPRMLVGRLADLRRPDAIIMDEAGFRQLWPDEPLAAGKVFEMNDRRAVIVGICRASRTFQTFPVVYTRFSQATDFALRERKTLSFILAQNAPGEPTEAVCRRITAETGLLAQTRMQFAWATIRHYLERTGIPINFAITVGLGFVVGTVVAGQTFYLFTLENLKQFAALKAMGVTNLRIVGMIFLQGMVVGTIGYGLGVGAAALFGAATRRTATMAFFMPWQVLIGTGAAVLVIVLVASMLSIRRVLIVEPALVFQGGV